MGSRTRAADVDWLYVSFHLPDVYELEAVSPCLCTPTGDIKVPPILYPYAAPRLRPLLRNELFPAGWMRQLHEGIAESLPENIHALSKTLKANLRNSWWETALKMERFLDSESKNQLTQREKSSDFS